MVEIDTKKLKRNPKAILKLLKKKGKTYIAEDNLRIVFPERYINKNLAIMGSLVKVVSIYAILDDHNNYAIVMAPIYQEVSPVNVGEALVGGVINKVLYFDKGSIVVPNVDMLINPEFVYDLFDEFFIKGNIPWFLEYEDVSNLLLETKKYADSNVGKNPLTMEILTSILARNKFDKKIFYRQTMKSKDDLKKNPPVFVGLSNIYYSFDSTNAKLIGSYYGYGVTTAIVDPEKETTVVADILRQ